MFKPTAIASVVVIAEAAKLTMTSDPICSSAGCTQYEHPKEDDGIKRDYFVPDFGKDHLLKQSDSSISYAEGKLGHKWNWSQDKPAKEVIYNDIRPLDSDIATSMANQKEAAGKLGTWDLPKDDWFVQTQSDPICSSAGCDQYKHLKKDRGYDIDYPVPQLGVDRDIVGAHENLDVAEKIVGHHLIMGTKESQAQWKNPAKKTLYDYAPKLDKDMRNTEGSIEQIEHREGHKFEPWTFVQTESDPVCSSAGCDQYKHKKKARGYDIDYPVPNLGVDRDIEGAHEDLAVAEKMIGHHLVMGTKESKAQWANPAKKTMYDYAPKLDKDMRNTAGSIDQIEDREGHKFEPWNFVQLASDPITSSAGLTQYRHPKMDEDHPVDYAVANWGDLDTEIADHFENLKIAEKITGHKWDFILDPPPLNPAKKTLYDYSPKLDRDIIDSNGSLEHAEDRLNLKYAAWMN